MNKSGLILLISAIIPAAKTGPIPLQGIFLIPHDGWQILAFSNTNVISTQESMDEIRKAAYAKMDADAKKHIYTHSFSDFYYRKMKESEKTVRKDDLLFCGAPHLFIAHE